MPNILEIATDMPTGQRIRGARIRAGYLSGVDVAAALGLSKSKYQKLEAGLIVLNAIDRAAIAHLFNVSDAYLGEGHVKTPRDEASARLAAILERAGDVSPPEAGGRLAAARIKRGFRSARAAAEHHGWGQQTYGGYERVTHPLPTERLIGFALGFGVRPEYIIFGNEPIEPATHEKIEEWIDVRGRNQKSRPSEAVAWRWLKRQTATDTITIGLVESSVGGLSQSKLRSMVLPIEAFRTQPVTPYGIVNRIEGGGIEVLIVDPSTADGADTVLLIDGVVKIEASGNSGAAKLDPLSIVAKDSSTILLGSLIGKVSIG
ncbi:transcriptional regulator with XRE-family HTH domain [Devosia sp. UYZn731]|uniref:helix-turn-helix transcriptional regulator n=1 Tax=Devosia sp. UYZn731 TaxID=3156345 RepID=UPI0033982275